MLPQLALFLEEHRVLPEAFTNGLIRNDEANARRSSFLMGQYSIDGWSYYFPLAFVFKTPIATLLAIGLAIWVAIKRRAAGGDVWTMLCLAVPIFIYRAIAIGGHLNLGVRHLFPIYPFIFLSVGLGFARFWEWKRRPAIIVSTVLAVALAAETLAAMPDYIPFFNVAVGGSRGGLSLLTDSNIDWGQDAKLLARWQQRHPDAHLYVCYFGRADLKYYGIKYVNLPGGEEDRGALDKFPPLSEHDTWAISATNLQGTYFIPTLRSAYGMFAKGRNPSPCWAAQSIFTARTRMRLRRRNESGGRCPLCDRSSRVGQALPAADIDRSSRVRPALPAAAFDGNAIHPSSILAGFAHLSCGLCRDAGDFCQRGMAGGTRSVCDLR